MADSNPPASKERAAEWRAQLTTAPTQKTSSEKPRTSHLENRLSKLETVRAGLGLHTDPHIDERHKEHEHQELLWSRIRLSLREPFAEFMGVFIMILFGNGSVAQVLLSTGDTSAPGGDGYGNYQSISWGHVSPSIPLLSASMHANIWHIKLGHRRHAWHLCRWGLRSVPKSGHYVLQLPLPQAPVAAFPYIHVGAIPWWILRGGRSLHKLRCRHQQLRRRWRAYSATFKDRNCWDLLHIPAGILTEGEHVLL